MGVLPPGDTFFWNSPYLVKFKYQTFNLYKSSTVIYDNISVIVISCIALLVILSLVHIL